MFGSLHLSHLLFKTLRRYPIGYLYRYIIRTNRQILNSTFYMLPHHANLFMPFLWFPFRTYAVLPHLCDPFISLSWIPQNLYLAFPLLYKQHINSHKSLLYEFLVKHLSWHSNLAITCQISHGIYSNILLCPYMLS